MGKSASNKHKHTGLTPIEVVLKHGKKKSWRVTMKAHRIYFLPTAHGEEKHPTAEETLTRNVSKEYLGIPDEPPFVTNLAQAYNKREYRNTQKFQTGGLSH